MNTEEFIRSLAAKLQINRKEAARLLQDTTGVIREIVSEEQKITLQHLGSFQVKQIPSRTAYIPALDKKALVPPRKIIQFHVAETLKNKLKNLRRP